MPQSTRKNRSKIYVRRELPFRAAYNNNHVDTPIIYALVRSFWFSMQSSILILFLLAAAVSAMPVVSVVLSDRIWTHAQCRRICDT